MAREQFMANPKKYLTQTPPGTQVPIRLAIVGPPKSGKSEGTCNYCIGIIVLHNIDYCEIDSLPTVILYTG